MEKKYRPNVAAIVLSPKYPLECKVLLAKRNDMLDIWQFPQGGIDKDESASVALLRELKEEIGVEFSEKEAVLLKEIVRDKEVADIKDMWPFRRDIKEEEITFPDGESTEFKWVTIDEFIEMFNNNEIIPNINFGREDYEKALKM